MRSVKGTVKERINDEKGQDEEPGQKHYVVVPHDGWPKSEYSGTQRSRTEIMQGYTAENGRSA